MCYKWQLIYIYDESSGIEAVLNGEYDIKRIKERTFKVSKEKNYIKHLWGSNITDCYALVGENGSGKTQTMNAIRCLYSYSDCEKKKINSTLFALFEKRKQGQKSLVYAYDGSIKESNNDKTNVNKEEDIQIILDDILIKEGVTWSKIDNEWDEIRKRDIAYFNNVLNKNDYIFRSYKYDFSLANMIRQYRNQSFEMKYKDLNYSEVMNFFFCQMYGMLEFIFDYIERKDNSIPFSLPREIYISFSDDSINKDYIRQEINKINDYSVRDSVTHLFSFIENPKATPPHGDKLFHDIIDEIDSFVKNQKQESVWINTTAEKVLINCFKVFVVNQTSNQSVMSPNDFLKILKSSNKKDKDVLENLKELLENLKKTQRYNFSYDAVFKDYVDDSNDFIDFISTNRKEIISHISSYNSNVLTLQLNDDSKELLKELLEKYNKIRLPFHFYEFDFNISTGEYYFLLLFCNLYKIKKDNNNEKRNLLLLLDEAELSFHPRWQRDYINWLTQFINNVFKNDCVQIIIATHSPILLSDFPETNVLYLSREKGKYHIKKEKNKKTFGSNIHALFLNSFFLENHGTMGSFAEKRINGVVSKILEDSEYDLADEDIYKLINSIGDDILQDHIKSLASKTKMLPIINQDMSNETIQLLKQQRDSLDELILRLEKEND